MTGKIVSTIPLLLLAFLFFPNFSFGAEAQFGYRVTHSGKTVIQIARDVYNDQRQWKKIAYWNNLSPPYSLSAGQVLVLPMPPITKLSETNLMTGADVPAPQFLQQLPSVSRVILDRKGYYVYEVNERAPSLSMVALENYDDKNWTKLIARWNGLAPDEHLSLGQKLILHKKPILTAAQSNSVLIKEWARVGNEPMVQRLSGHSSASFPEVLKLETHTDVKRLPAKVEAPPALPATSSAKDVAAKITSPTLKNETGAVLPVDTEKRTDSEKSQSDSSEKDRSNSVPAVAIPTRPSVPNAPVPSLPSLPLLPSLPTSSASKASPAEDAEEQPVYGSKKLPEKKGQSVVTEPATLGQPINTMETPTPNVINPSDDPELQHIHQNTGTSIPTPNQVAPIQHVENDQPSPALQKQVEQHVQEAPNQVPQQTPLPNTVQQPDTSLSAASAQDPAALPVPNPAQPVQPQEQTRQPSSTSTDSAQLAEPTSDFYWLGSDTTRIMKTLTKPNGK